MYLLLRLKNKIYKILKQSAGFQSSKIIIKGREENSIRFLQNQLLTTPNTVS